MMRVTRHTAQDMKDLGYDVAEKPEDVADDLTGKTDAEIMRLCRQLELGSFPTRGEAIEAIKRKVSGGGAARKANAKSMTPAENKSMKPKENK